MQRGDVWLVRLPFTGGHEQAGERPAVVIQDAVYGQGSPLVLIVLLTSQLTALRFPATVAIDPTTQNGLTMQSVAMVFQARALDRSRFSKRLGEIEESALQEILREINRLTGQ